MVSMKHTVRAFFGLIHKTGKGYAAIHLFQINGPKRLFQKEGALHDRMGCLAPGGRQNVPVAGKLVGEPSAHHDIIALITAKVGDSLQRVR